MLTFARSYQTTDGTCHATLEAAQTVEVAMLLGLGTTDSIAKAIVANKDALVSILTITDNSRPRARGVSKKRKPKTDAAPAVVLESVPSGVVTS